MFASRYGDVFKGDKNWQGIQVAGGQTYAWDVGSTYVQNPPYFVDMSHGRRPRSPTSSRRGSWACSATPSPPTTSRPAGSIKASSAGRQVYLIVSASRAAVGVQLLRRASGQPRRDDARHLRQHPHPQQASPRRSRAASPSTSRRATVMSIYDAAMKLPRKKAARPWCSPARNTAPARPATGPPRAPSSWASAPSSAESYERIHRSNLVGMGVLPLQFLQEGWHKLEPDRRGDRHDPRPHRAGPAQAADRRDVPSDSDGRIARFPVRCRIDTPTELEYFKNGGVLNYVLRNLAQGRLSRTLKRHEMAAGPSRGRPFSCLRRTDNGVGPLSPHMTRLFTAS